MIAKLNTFVIDAGPIHLTCSVSNYAVQQMSVGVLLAVIVLFLTVVLIAMLDGEVLRHGPGCSCNQCQERDKIT